MNKLNRISNILFLVAIAFFIKAYQNQNMVLVLVGFLLIALAIFRRMLVKQAVNMDDGELYDGEDSIIRYLKKDPARYVEMLEVYRRGNCEILYEENDGILLYDHTLHEYLATASTVAGAEDIILKLPSDYEMLIVHDDVFLTLENTHFNFAKKLVFYNHIYAKRGLYKIPKNNIEFKKLDKQDIPAIKEHYSVKDLCTDEYLQDRIKDGMLGAFLNDTLVGFIGIHDNGAMGMLEVFENYRGKHIGMLLQMMYTNQLIDSKYPGYIYCQIYEDNTASMNLQKKLLLAKAKKPCYWYFH